MLGPFLSHPKQTMARSLWICPRRAGPAVEEIQGDDQGRQADRDGQEGGAGGGRGNYGAGTSPAGALAHVPFVVRVGLKDGGKRERYYYFLFFFCKRNKTKQTIVLANARG